jgi:hypothetical protein
MNTFSYNAYGNLIPPNALSALLQNNQTKMIGKVTLYLPERLTDDALFMFGVPVRKCPCCLMPQAGWFMEVDIHRPTVDALDVSRYAYASEAPVALDGMVGC